MTQRKRFKTLVRARMERTGESYTTARRRLLGEGGSRPASARHHFPGSTPAPTALRALLTGAGIRAPHTSRPFSEAMVFGIAGGIGAGVFAFHYAKENFSSFFIAGRHLWHDTEAWTASAVERFGATSVQRESGSPKAAEKHLRELLQRGRPVMAWLAFRGRQYHVATVHGIDDEAGVALVGDLGDEPIRVPLDALAAARATTRKGRNRLLALEPARAAVPLERMVHRGVSACCTALARPKQVNFGLEAFRSWAERLDGSAGPNSWEAMFPPGPLMYAGLRSACEFIEHYDTGGGLSRPLFAEFLEEAGDALGKPGLRRLAERYAELGRGWTALANAALPDEVPAFREAKAILEQRAEAMAGATMADDAETALSERALADAEALFEGGFPLSDTEARTLRRELKARVLALYEAEQVALDALGEWSGMAG